MADRPGPVSKFLKLVEQLVGYADDVEYLANQLGRMEHDGFRAQARHLELVAEALDNVDRVHGEILPIIDELRTRWNDPDT